MSEYIEKFKVVATNTDGEKDTYWYKYSEFNTDDRSGILFYLYARMNWHSLKSDMSKTFDDKELQNQKLKENKEKYLELVQNFLNKVVSSNNFYLKGKGKRWNWKLDDVKVKQDTWIQGQNNRKIFDLWKGSKVSIKTPNFEINNDTGLNEYEFERDLLNANFYLKNFIWSEKQPNPYTNDKEFVKQLDTMITKIRDENLRTFENKDVIYKDLKNSTGIKLTEIENSFKDIERELRKTFTTYDAKLTIAEYENILDFTDMVRHIDKLQEPNSYTVNAISHYFKNFLKENEYLKKPYVNSLSKDELAQMMLYKEQGNYDKADELKKTILLRFFKNNQKAIVDLFLENKILSINIK